MSDPANVLYFDAELTPNRSLSPKAFTLVMSIVAAMSFIAGLSFMTMGAFPIIGFFGLDALAIWVAFQLSFRALRQVTHVEVTAERIQIRHTRPGKPEKVVDIPTLFARIDLIFPERRPSELRISYGGTVWAIGRFLTGGERRDLCSALKDAVGRARLERYA